MTSYACFIIINFLVKPTALEFGLVLYKIDGLISVLLFLICPNRPQAHDFRYMSEKYLFPLKVTVPNIGKGNHSEISIGLKGQ